MRICGPCNSRLGETFEHRAAPILKPVITGHAVVLSPKHQVIVGAYLVKMLTLIAQKYSRFGAGREYLRRVLLDLMDTGVPPAGASVRIGLIDPYDKTESPIPQFPQPFEPVTYPPVVQWATWSLGFLEYEVLLMPPGDALNLVAETPDNDSFVRVWPPKVDGVAWPPPKALTRAQVAAYESTWRDHTVAAHLARPTASDFLNPKGNPPPVMGRH